MRAALGVSQLALLTWQVGRDVWCCLFWGRIAGLVIMIILLIPSVLLQAWFLVMVLICVLYRDSVTRGPSWAAAVGRDLENKQELGLEFLVPKVLLSPLFLRRTVAVRNPPGEGSEGL